MSWFVEKLLRRSMSYQAMWFQSIAAKMRIIDPKFSQYPVSKLKYVCSLYLRRILDRIYSDDLDENNPFIWWDQLNVDMLLKLERNDGAYERVAICIMTELSRAERVHKQLRHYNYCKMRKAFGIQRHWVCLVSKYHPHTWYEWCDLLYSEIDKTADQSGCKILYLVN